MCRLRYNQQVLETVYQWFFGRLNTALHFLNQLAHVKLSIAQLANRSSLRRSTILVWGWLRIQSRLYDAFRIVWITAESAEYHVTATVELCAASGTLSDCVLSFDWAVSKENTLFVLVRMLDIANIEVGGFLGEVVHQLLLDHIRVDWNIARLVQNQRRSVCIICTGSHVRILLRINLDLKIFLAFIA